MALIAPLVETNGPLANGANKAAMPILGRMDPKLSGAVVGAGQTHIGYEAVGAVVAQHRQISNGYVSHLGAYLLLLLPQLIADIIGS